MTRGVTRAAVWFAALVVIGSAMRANAQGASGPVRGTGGGANGGGGVRPVPVKVAVRADAVRRIRRIERSARTRWTRLRNDFRQLELSVRVLRTGRRGAPATPRAAAPAARPTRWATVEGTRAEVRAAYDTFRHAANRSARALRTADPATAASCVGRVERWYERFATAASTLQLQQKTLARELTRIGRTRAAPASPRSGADSRARLANARKREALAAKQRRALAAKVRTEQARLRKVDEDLAALRRRIAALRVQITRVRAAEPIAPK